jgi:hypothetical protein
MKKALILLLGILVLGIGQAQAQMNPDFISMKKGKFYDENGMVLSPEQIKQIIGNEIYKDTYLGATKQYKAGKTLVAAGAIGFGVGIATAVGCAAKYNSDEYLDTIDETLEAGIYGGYILAVLGGLALDAGIPFLIIGKNRLNWIAENYNETKSVSLRLTGCSAGTGLGLALVF